MLGGVDGGARTTHRYSSARRLAACHLHLIGAPHHHRSGASSSAHARCLLDASGTRAVFRPVSVLVVLLGGRTAHLLLWAGLLDHPVEDEVVLVAHPIEQVLEKLAQVANVRLLLELQTAAVVQVDAELVGQVLRQRLYRRR